MPSGNSARLVDGAIQQPAADPRQQRATLKTSAAAASAAACQPGQRAQQQREQAGSDVDPLARVSEWCGASRREASGVSFSGCERPRDSLLERRDV